MGRDPIETFEPRDDEGDEEESGCGCGCAIIFVVLIAVVVALVMFFDWAPWEYFGWDTPWEYFREFLE